MMISYPRAVLNRVSHTIKTNTLNMPRVYIGMALGDTEELLE